MGNCNGDRTDSRCQLVRCGGYLESCLRAYPSRLSIKLSLWRHRGIELLQLLIAAARELVVQIRRELHVDRARPESLSKLTLRVKIGGNRRLRYRLSVAPGAAAPAWRELRALARQPAGPARELEPVAGREWAVELAARRHAAAAEPEPAFDRRRGWEWALALEPARCHSRSALRAGLSHPSWSVSKGRANCPTARMAWAWAWSLSLNSESMRMCPSPRQRSGRDNPA